jgi:hypothetical protein
MVLTMRDLPPVAVRTPPWSSGSVGKLPASGTER